MATEHASTRSPLMGHRVEVTVGDPGLARNATAQLEHTIWTLNAEPWRVRTTVATNDADVSVPHDRRPGAGSWVAVQPALQKFLHTAKREVRLADTPVTVSGTASPPDRKVDLTVQTYLTPAAFWRLEQLTDMHIGLPIVTA